MSEPTHKPTRPFFGSGPTAKRPGWSFDALKNAALSRSHRSVLGAGKITDLIDQTRSFLSIPPDYKIALMPGSATGAMESLLWSVLGPRPVDCIAVDVFGQRWAWDITEQLGGLDVRIFNDRNHPKQNIDALNFDNDIVFLWNNSTAGTCVPNGDFIPENRQGLTICDATSAIFCVPIPFDRLDAVAFSFQKGLGGEGGLGMIALSPRAVERIESHKPTWPIPYLFRLRDFKGAPHYRLFDGDTLNTPSLLCIEDALDGLNWGQEMGGLPAMVTRTRQNAEIVMDWIHGSPWAVSLCPDPDFQSPTTLCFTVRHGIIDDVRSLIDRAALILSDRGIAVDSKNHRAAPPSFRIWCGPTVESDDIRRLLPWIDWAVLTDMGTNRDKDR